MARAYLDQLGRANALPKERIDALNASMKEVEGATGAARRTAVTTLNGLAAELTKSAASVTGANAAKMKAAASVIQKHNAELK